MTEEKFKARTIAVYWAITWPGLGTFIIRKGKTAGEAYESIEGLPKPPFGVCKYIEAL
jgi:hypothetical protein